MARILLSGNELNDYRAEGWTEFSGSPTTSANQPGGRKTIQGNCGRFYFYLDASIGLNQIIKTLPNVATGAATGGYTEIFGRFAWHGAGNRTTRNLIAFRNSNTGLIVGFLYAVDSGGGNNQFVQARNGAGSSLGQSIIAFNNAPTTNGGFVRIEFHFKCAASGGIWEVWVDDTLFLTLSGLNTSNGATTVFDQVIIGQTDNTSIANYWDDICINDLTGTVNNGRVGEGVVMALFPTRTGTFSQLQNTYGTSVENFDHVNRLITPYNDPFNNSLYVGTSTPGKKDSYKMGSLPAEIGGIGALKVIANAVRNGAAITNAKMLLQPGVRAPNSTVGGAVAAGGVGTAGDHQFVVVNRIGLGYSLPSALVAPLTFGAGNNQANLVVPVSSSPLVTARDIYASKANTGTTIAALSNGQVLPQGTINVGSTTGFAAAGTILVTTSDGLQLVTYTGVTATSFTGCTGGSGTMVTGGFVVQALYLVGTLNDNVTTAFPFNLADGSFGTLQAPVESSSPNLALPNGGFGYIESIFDKDPITGNAWTKDHVEEIEAGLQFTT
jgi:hypothetical protein